MECYICHSIVKRHEYTRHVGSHLAGDGAGVGYQPEPEPEPDPSFVSPTTVAYEHYHGGASPLTTQRTRQTEQPTRPNTFQAWLNNRRARVQCAPVNGDGREDEYELQQKFVQAAETLRRTTKEHVINMVEKFKGFSSVDDQKTCLDLVRETPIFPGLVAYVYAHLVVCPRRGPFSALLVGLFAIDDQSGRVSELKQLVKRWAQYDSVSSVLSYHTVKDELLKIMRATRTHAGHKCSLGSLNGNVVSDHDILNLAALTTLCITGPRRDDILDQRGAKAEMMIELFHDLLEANVGLEGWYQRHLFKSLVKLSKEVRCCPRGIYIPEGAIENISSLGAAGGFGELYQGTIGSPGRLVAVKVLKRSNLTSLSEYNKDLAREAIVWRHLRHPNCLPFYGVYIMSRDGLNLGAALISPLMKHGTLFQYLERNPRTNRTSLILDVVRGLNYLHSMQPHVAHRDIKPDNILITNKGRACLADFGLAQTIDTNFRAITSQDGMAGTRRYIAPEIFKAESQDALRKVNKRACDMYALGCTIYAAYAGKHPFQNLQDNCICAFVLSGRRPGFPKGRISLEMWSFVENLWSADPSDRLTAQGALDWMEFRASQEGVDVSLVPLEEEWQWKGPRHDECLWSVQS